MRAAIRGGTVRVVADDCLAFSAQGLARRARLDIGGRDETPYLAPLDDIVARGRTLAEDLIEKYKGEWGSLVEPAFTDLAL